MSIEEFIINVFCIIDERYKELMLDYRLRRRGPAPKLTDAEVLTMELVGEFLGLDADMEIWNYFKRHWSSWFPCLGSRSNFVRQSANLWNIKQRLQARLVKEIGAKEDSHYFVDGFPIPICGFRRAPICQRFKGTAAYSYCASKSLFYYGFRGHVVVNWEGVILGLTVTPANVDERQAMWDMVEDTAGIWIGDKGYEGEFLKEMLKEKEIKLITPSNKRKKEKIPKEMETLILSVRRKVETVISQMCERFHIEKMRARDIWHLTNRMARKVVSHTMSIFLNKKYGNEPLQFQALLNT